MPVEATAAVRPKPSAKGMRAFQASAESRPLSLRKNFSWAMFGSGFYAVCQFGLLVALTKIGSVQMAGQYTLGLAVTAPAIICLGFNLRGVIVSDSHRECPFGVYLAFRLLAMATAMCVIGVIVLIAGYRRETAMVIMLIAVTKSIESISDIFFGYFQQNERMDQITISMIIKGILSVLLFINGMWFFGSVLGGIAGLITAWLTTLFFYDIPRAVLSAKRRAEHQQTRKESFWPKWDWGRIGHLFVLSAPLGVVMMVASLNANIPRYFVEAWHGEAALGIFGPISYFMVLGNLVVMALGQSAAPRMAKYYSEGNRRAIIVLLVKQNAVGVFWGAVMILMAATAGGWILETFFGPEYASAQMVFLLMTVAISVSFISTFCSITLTAMRVFRAQIPLVAVTACVIFTACQALVPQHAIVGAALAMIIGTTFQTAIYVLTLSTVIHRMGKHSHISGEMANQCFSSLRVTKE